MELDREKLKAACFAVATNTMWERRPVDVEDIEAVAESYFKIAEHHEEFIKGQKRDPNIIVRAVHYINHFHAMPPMKDDTKWFSNMLDVLVELACPNTIASSELESFYRDVEQGITESRSNYQD
jgi:Fic family protein